MSTRAHIAICKNAGEQENGKFLHLSHHCDGYPSGVGCELSEIMKCYDIKVGTDWNPLDVQNFIHKYDDDYRITNNGVAWDQEYVYVINCEERRIRGYYKGLSDDFDLTCPGDELYIEGNEYMGLKPQVQPDDMLVSIATAAMQSILSNPSLINTENLSQIKSVAVISVNYAKTLLEEINNKNK